MKSLFPLIFMLLATLSAAAAPDAYITVKVLDELGNPIEGAAVAVHFEVYGEHVNKVEGVSDENGCFSAKGKTGPILAKTAIKEGFYETNEIHMFKALNKKRTRYEPWGDVRTLILRQIIDPKEGKTVSVDAFNHKNKDNWELLEKEVGFDFLIGDWVAPHGKGEIADFILMSEYNEGNKFYSYSISFVGEGNGISELPITTKNYDSWSALRWPHKAPLDGYLNIVKKKITLTGGDSSELVDFQEIPRRYESKMDHLFRVRTRYDENGNILSAHYGKMKGYMRINRISGLTFSYWINTDSGSRSLESKKRY